MAMQIKLLKSKRLILLYIHIDNFVFLSNLQWDSYLIR